MEIFNLDSYLGFTENKRIMETLSKLIKYQGELNCVLSRKDFIFNLLCDGYTPELSEDDNNKVIYSIIKSFDTYTSRWKVTKTEYDFAVYLLDNNLNTIQAAKEYIVNEQAKKLKEDEKLKNEAQKIQKIKEKEEQEQKEFNCWLENKTKSYNNNEKVKIVNDIFLDINGKEAEEFGIKLLILIENIDNQLCKKYLKEILHNNNKASIKAFSQITGLKTPSTYKERIDFINTVSITDFKEIIQYKRKRSYCDEFYMSNSEGKYVKVLGEPINLFDFELFYNEKNNTLSFKNCGILAAKGCSKEDCINIFTSLIEENGIDEIKKRVKEFISKFGLCPGN